MSMEVTADSRQMSKLLGANSRSISSSLLDLVVGLSFLSRSLEKTSLCKRALALRYLKLRMMSEERDAESEETESKSAWEMIWTSTGSPAFHSSNDSSISRILLNSSIADCFGALSKF